MGKLLRVVLEGVGKEERYATHVCSSHPPIARSYPHALAAYLTQFLPSRGPTTMFEYLHITLHEGVPTDRTHFRSARASDLR
jgi:hypothetical protein